MFKWIPLPPSMFFSVSMLRVALFICPAAITAAQHPSLLFSDTAVAGMKQAALTTHAAIWKPIRDKAASLLTASAPVEPSAAGLQQYYNFADNLTILAFVSLFDSSYFVKARECFLAYASWTYWGDEQQLGGRDLGLAAMIRGYAVAYDWLYPRLSDSERVVARTALGTHTAEEYQAAISGYNPTWNSWWGKCYIQNHWSTNNSSIGLAALVLEGDDARSAAWLDHVTSEMRRDSAILENIPDGTWHEGIHYQNWKFEAPMQFYTAMKRLKGADLVPHNYLKAIASYRLCSYLPGQVMYSRAFPSCAMPVADYEFSYGGVNIGGGQALLAFIARHERSSRAQWVNQCIRTDEGPRPTWRAKESVLEFLFYDPAVPATTPEPALSSTLSDLEGVIWRTGWGANDLVFGLKTGGNGGRYIFNQYLNKLYPLENNGYANVGHDHKDANSFNIFKGPTDLMSEMPSKSSTGSECHNTLLVDGLGQFQTQWNWVYPNTDGKLVSVCGTKGFDYLAAEASNCYRSRGTTGNADGPGPKWLTEFTRRVLFVRPGYFLMADNVRSDSVHQYTWVSYFSQAKQGPVVREKDWVKAPAMNGQTMGVKILAPAGFSCAIDSTAYLYSGTPPQTKPCVKISPSAAVANTHFINVLYPIATAQWNDKPEISLMADTMGGAAVRVALNGTHDHLLNFRGDSLITVGGYSLAGQAASIMRDTAGNLLRVFLAAGRRLAGSGATLIECASPLTVEAAYAHDTLNLSGTGIAQGLRIYGPSIDTGKVTVNGLPNKAGKNGNYIILGAGASARRSGANRNSASAFRIINVPDRSAAIIRYRLVHAGLVAISLHTLNGALVRNLVNEHRPAGDYSVEVTPADCGPGVYLVKTAVGNVLGSGKLILIK